MPTEIRMPRLADTLVEGTLARWLKAVNDPVQAGEPLAEIETDKVTTELTAPVTGTLSELLVTAGQTVPVGTLLARIRAHDEDQVLAPTPRVTPLAARIARAHSVDLRAVKPSGAHITRADIERYLAQSGQAQPASSQPVAVRDRLSRPIADRNKLLQEAEETTAPQPPEQAKAKPGELLALTGLRRATAARMAAIRQVPASTAVVEADATALVAAYRQERDAWLAREGFPLTYTPYFLYALAQTLRAWPAARAMLREGRCEPRDGVHIGVAVALNEGLIVPVIRDADQQDVYALARSLADLVARARARCLRPEEITGGIATLTNVGSVGGLLALPMLNENQAVMLGVGTINCCAVGDHQGIHYRYRVYLALTFDRRLLDDLQAEHFLLDVARADSQPLQP
jgi:pyruvate/2-oxoglutarate dehydrogenase complex dihydrolipoamide acyltransferase (E2) component